MRTKLMIFFIFSIFFLTLTHTAYAMGLDDDMEDAEDVADLLMQAKKAAKNESFDKANGLLKKAKVYGVSKKKVEETARFIEQKKQERNERLARLRREREERERREREKAQRT